MEQVVDMNEQINILIAKNHSKQTLVAPLV